jgi:hypothetical protein
MAASDCSRYLVAIPAAILLGRSRAAFPVLVVDCYFARTCRRDHVPDSHGTGLGERLGLSEGLGSRQFAGFNPHFPHRHWARWLLAAKGSEAFVRLSVGLISLGFVAVAGSQRSQRWSGAKIVPGIFWGTLAGFTVFVSHPGSPPSQVYVMPQRLSPRVFAGTGTMFFATANLLKIPPYFSLGSLAENLAASARLLPWAVGATLCGIWACAAGSGR